jgi:flavin reductase (DIM6/NTAB) family NADH-FMN oxidoreductase RutF
MTMSSFTSLSLDPSPIVSLNIASPSRTLDAVSASRHFNVHIMAGDAAGARVADWFTRGNAEGIKAFEEDRLWEGCGCSMAASADGTEPPMLMGRGILYVLRCRLLDEPSGGLVRVRDHFIVLGEVLDIVEGEGTSLNNGEERFGLIYADRKYRQLGNTMIKTGEDGS